MKSHEFTSYLGLGSNLGNRRKNLEIVIRTLSKHSDIHVTAFSSFYETEPVGYKKQGWFINQVIQIETSLSPPDLLKVTQKLEEALGRRRTIKWGPRTVDIDILLYSDLIMNNPSLRIPHPHLTRRRFVLVPLSEIAPSMIHPIIGGTIKEILIDSTSGDLVKRI